jgi:hypothetical protein
MARKNAWLESSEAASLSIGVALNRLSGAFVLLPDIRQSRP